jgi:hypothetical protein
MMKNYMTTGTFARAKKPEDEPTRKAAAPFLEEKAVMSIYGGPTPHESWCKLKLTGRVINVVSPAVSEYLCWSESPISFDSIDHLDSISKTGRLPLIVELLVGTTRLTKVLMDRGSGLNLMYLNTFEGLGLTHDLLQSSPHPFYGVVSGKQYVPHQRVTLPVTFEDASNYHNEMLAFEVVDFFRHYHVILGYPWYVKFMAIPNYTYLKLKILEPIGGITVEVVDVSYAAPQAHRIVNVALHQEYSPGIIFIFSQGRKDLYHV